MPSPTYCTTSTTSRYHVISLFESILQRLNRLAGLFNTHILQCTQDRTGSCKKATVRGRRITLQAPGANAERLHEYLSPLKTRDLHFRGCTCLLGHLSPLSASPGVGSNSRSCPRGRSGSVRLVLYVTPIGLSGAVMTFQRESHVCRYLPTKARMERLRLYPGTEGSVPLSQCRRA